MTAEVKELVEAAEAVVAGFIPARGEAAAIFAQFPNLARLVNAVEKVKKAS